DSVIESDTPTDLLDRLGYLEKSAQAQQQALDGFIASREVARQADDAATRTQQQADAAAQRAGQALAEAQAAEAAAEQDQAGVTTLVAQQQQAMATANAQRDATLAQYAE